MHIYIYIHIVYFDHTHSPVHSLVPSTPADPLPLPNESCIYFHVVGCVCVCVYVPMSPVIKVAFRQVGILPMYTTLKKMPLSPPSNH